MKRLDPTSAIALLREFLLDWRLSGFMKQEAERRGISPHTLRLAREELEVFVQRVDKGSDHQSWWILPQGRDLSSYGLVTIRELGESQEQHAERHRARIRCVHGAGLGHRRVA